MAPQLVDLTAGGSASYEDPSSCDYGGLDDLIDLPVLDSSTILEAVRVRYARGTIYTNTGPILLAVNPLRNIEGLYSDETRGMYMSRGEGRPASDDGVGTLGGIGRLSPPSSPGADLVARAPSAPLPPHVYATADDAYRAMKRGMETSVLLSSPGPGGRGSGGAEAPADQSILVSGESGAGKTVSTKIVLDYLAMLSGRAAGAEEEMRRRSISPRGLGRGDSGLETTSRGAGCGGRGGASIEETVLRSNPILEAFGNARTVKNDNSSRFGKYIDVSFTASGRLDGAAIDTYLLEKVRLVRPSEGERNYHIFYQLLGSVADGSGESGRELGLEGLSPSDFRLLCRTGVHGRRDGARDADLHAEMLDSMDVVGLGAETASSVLRVVAAILHCGNLEFLPDDGADACRLRRDTSAAAACRLLGVDAGSLEGALTHRDILAGKETIRAPMDAESSERCLEALMKGIYGATFEYLVTRINGGIRSRGAGDGRGAPPGPRARIGVLDIFGFEIFEKNSLEQLCINLTNETLQQTFNQFVFKLEQQEYEREGISYEFVAFEDNQDVLDLIQCGRTGILGLLDEHCIVGHSSDEKFTRNLYVRCDNHARFIATPSQQSGSDLFSVRHYAGPVEYDTGGWLEKNEDRLPASSVRLIEGSGFGLLREIGVSFSVTRADYEIPISLFTACSFSYRNSSGEMTGTAAGPWRPRA